MSLIRILNEKDFFENAKMGHILRPANFSMIFIRSGSIHLEINNQSVSYVEDHVLLISSHNSYKLSHYTDDLKIYMLIYNRETIREKIHFNFSRYDVYRIINAEKNQNIFNPDKVIFDQLTGLVELMIYQTDLENRQSFFHEQIILSIFSTITYKLMDSLEIQLQFDRKRNARKEEITLQFLELATDYYKTEKELDFYAKKLNISIKYLSICVKEITDIAPSVFIATALLNEAKTLLFSSKDTITRIAEELNFSDQYAFGKFFKKHTGLSPKNYRNKHEVTLF